MTPEILAAIRLAVDVLDHPWSPSQGDVAETARRRGAAAVLRLAFLTGCPGCGLPLDGRARTGQRYHSGACRVRAHRARRIAAGTPNKGVTGASET